MIDINKLLKQRRLAQVERMKYTIAGIREEMKKMQAETEKTKADLDHLDKVWFDLEQQHIRLTGKDID